MDETRGEILWPLVHFSAEILLFRCPCRVEKERKKERKNYLDRIVDIHSYKYRLNARDPRIEFMQGKGEGGGHNERVPGAYYSCYLAVNQS